MLPSVFRLILLGREGDSFPSMTRWPWSAVTRLASDGLQHCLFIFFHWRQNGQNVLFEIGPLDRTGSVDRMDCVQNGQNGQRVLLLLELTLSLAMLPRID